MIFSLFCVQVETKEMYNNKKREGRKMSSWGKIINNVRYYVCIDKIDENSDIKGRIYQSYMPDALVFQTSIEFICKMDAFMDKINYPQRSTQNRKFESRNQQVHNNGYDNLQQIVKVVEEEQIMDYRGEKATFVLEVKYRENATWQGTVEWVEGGNKQAFRSALELIKLIDSVNSKGEE